jgi:hypothetical protein
MIDSHASGRETGEILPKGIPVTLTIKWRAIIIKDREVVCFNPRIERERKTVSKMIRLHCKKKHDQKTGLCPQCTELKAYSHYRLDNCRHRDNKPTCNNCETHCYKPERREQILAVMRYSGPRLLFRHPVLTVRHLLDARKK